jgi:hypothetical protein
LDALSLPVRRVGDRAAMALVKHNLCVRAVGDVDVDELIDRTKKDLSDIWPLRSLTSRMVTSPVNHGLMMDALSPAAERSGAGGDNVAGGRSSTSWRRMSHTVGQPDRRRSRGTSPNSRPSGAASCCYSSHSRGRDASMSSSAPSVHVGIDVAKATLELCLLPDGQTLSLGNDDAGIAQVVALLRQHPIALVLLEATNRRPCCCSMRLNGGTDSTG